MTTLWYSTLGIGDSHDVATRGYLDSLLAVGYAGLRLPPSRTTGLLNIRPGSELARYAHLAMPPSPAKAVYVQPGDHRVGTPRPVAFPDGGAYPGPAGEMTLDPVGPEDRLWRAGDFDPANTPREFFASAGERVDCVVVHHDPGSTARTVSGLLRLGRPPGVAYVGITVWEANRIPAEIAAVLGDLDVMVVPSRHTERAMLEGGLEVPICVIPHAADFDFWAQPDLRLEQAETYDFYSIATDIPRKNLDGLVKAFCLAFEGRKDVRLWLKVSGKPDALRRLMPARTLPQVVLLSQRWPMARVRELHLASDCYVDATRGEGFGLPHLEASLCGNPVVTTGWGAAPEVLEVAGGAYKLVDSALVPVPEEMAKYGPYSGAQLWAEPKLDDLVEAMRAMERDRPGRDPSKWTRLQPAYSTQAVGAALVEVLAGAKQAATCQAS